MNYEPNSDSCDKCGGRDASQLTDKAAKGLRQPDHGLEQFIGRSRPTSGELSVGHIYRLPTGGDGGINLCSRCWAHEMTWRRERNREVCNPYDILPFPEESCGQ